MRRGALVCALLLLTACSMWSGYAHPSPWGASDGCSSSPDLGPAVQCCFDHDDAYQRGGYRGTWTARERWVADLELMTCLLAHDVPSIVARSYYEAVREEGGAVWNRYREENGYGDP